MTTSSNQNAEYVPTCRTGPHMPKAHRNPYGKVLPPCACPCHVGNEWSPWWTEQPAQIDRSEEAR